MHSKINLRVGNCFLPRPLLSHWRSPVYAKDSKAQLCGKPGSLQYCEKLLWQCCSHSLPRGLSKEASSKQHRHVGVLTGVEVACLFRRRRLAGATAYERQTPSDTNFICQARADSRGDDYVVLLSCKLLSTTKLEQTTYGCSQQIPPTLLASVETQTQEVGCRNTGSFQESGALL